MKSLILAGLVASAFAVTTLPVYAVTDTAAVVKQQSMDTILSILNNADADTSPEQLKKELVEAIKLLCQNDVPTKLQDDVESGLCSATNIDRMIADVVAALGADNPLISDFLAALVEAGVNSDAVTLAAITAGIDATIASEATAAGPTPGLAPAAPVVVTLPTTTVPPGAGGTGGDAGISEVGN
ncbi:hypothetical protein I6F65_02145 [Pseudoalteromonas sp. SWXJZ94C]|uniref:hypothetical protein n=1 Tax=Pseudoalteromonas sp. SWXJZ94C TaxID=2792065 RepID=UPI0018CEEEAD|nr:hypothetical protein [Pseudoalteromonas sp. SWXJZ94C]MBH0055749.1 hypothetical protein [Pseudoalteromonas sp. SWXJZ94C]